MGWGFLTVLKDKEFLERYKTSTNDFVNELYQKNFSESMECCCVIGCPTHYKTNNYFVRMF